MGVVSESDWPYNTQWPPIEPDGLDSLAGKHRIGLYSRIQSLSDCKLALASGYPIVASFNITSQWKNPRGGKIKLHQSGTYPLGGHTVVLVGYNDRRKVLIFRNSWGQQWGDKGYGYLPYSLFIKDMTEAWCIDTRANLPDSSNSLILKEVSWGRLDYAGRLVHGLELQQSQDRIAWMFAVQRDQYLDVEEFFVMPGYRRKGHGGNMAIQLSSLAAELELKLRFLIPHADLNDLIGIKKIVSKLSLTIHNSPKKSAAKIASSAPSTPLQRRKVSRPDLRSLLWGKLW